MGGLDLQAWRARDPRQDHPHSMTGCRMDGQSCPQRFVQMILFASFIKNPYLELISPLCGDDRPQGRTAMQLNRASSAFVGHGCPLRLFRRRREGCGLQSMGLRPLARIDSSSHMITFCLFAIACGGINQTSGINWEQHTITYYLKSLRHRSII